MLYSTVGDMGGGDVGALAIGKSAARRITLGSGAGSGMWKDKHICLEAQSYAHR
jgi:hypothetical protein